MSLLVFLFFYVAGHRAVAWSLRWCRRGARWTCGPRPTTARPPHSRSTVSARTHTPTHTDTHTHTRPHTHTHTPTHTDTHTHTYIHTHTHAHIHTHAHAHTRTHIHAFNNLIKVCKCYIWNKVIVKNRLRSVKNSSSISLSRLKSTRIHIYVENFR